MLLLTLHRVGHFIRVHSCLSFVASIVFLVFLFLFLFSSLSSLSQVDRSIANPFRVRIAAARHKRLQGCIVRLKLTRFTRNFTHLITRRSDRIPSKRILQRRRNFLVGCSIDCCRILQIHAFIVPFTLFTDDISDSLAVHPRFTTPRTSFIIFFSRSR